MVGKDGKVRGIETLQCTQVFDEDGKFSPILKDGTEEKIEGDMIEV